MSTTTTILLVGGAALAALLLLSAVVILFALVDRQRRDLAVTAEALEQLGQQVAELETALRRMRAEHREAEAREGVVVDEAGVVALDRDDADARPVPDQLVLSATLGEPLVKVAAFGHGVRRAFRAESRNRIRFAMRQEVRRSRRQRRRDMKAAYRAMQLQEDPA